MLSILLLLVTFFSCSLNKGPHKFCSQHCFAFEVCPQKKEGTLTMATWAFQDMQQQLCFSLSPLGHQVEHPSRGRVPDGTVIIKAQLHLYLAGRQKGEFSLQLMLRPYDSNNFFRSRHVGSSQGLLRCWISKELSYILWNHWATSQQTRDAERASNLHTCQNSSSSMKTRVNWLVLKQRTHIPAGLEGEFILLTIMRTDSPVLFYHLLQT